MDNRHNHTYKDSGFNSFLRRTISPNDPSDARSLNDIARRATNNSIKFDQMGVEGSMGDSARIGDIALQGEKGRISIYDDDKEFTRWGNLVD